MIVDTLFDRGYLDGKSIQATPLGMQLIDSLEKYSPIIIDENLTRSLEEEMEKIQLSKFAIGLQNVDLSFIMSFRSKPGYFSIYQEFGK